ncbi:ABC-F family ATP-binding cassette domain-containing protein [Rhizobium leguminosarum]|uniref:ABC-F family ATP-binding cassette domain-containing protein n=1 Tax=Rhizobium leguminosarum TaxID=384 RepID=A0A4Q8XWR2_RHILE|nr:ABC-F family ATP-binding cassette domain-containing protein [Rhizobium leguminosarum]TAX54800.1 ABC-F family ATP-binding cassette domain-containing protein [Rhizobium leguminosarum]TAX59560.1 ABC-F family ATP-binding cassette domain-containing protein [Rhizobium leguminosarum]TAX71107.1 ABC-F family ATP-binding cassette domain-containing protein [Rhizobium leguminosarum]TAY00666.1 ABC-F family ATP-binding cassette domain-containing protein [Rhizobium leguminosarum]
MTLINIRNLGVTLGNPLFSKLNLVVNAGDRIGLVAANGRGKSTLLACITGALEPSEGEITKARGLTVGHVAQNVPPALFDMPFYDAVLQALPADQAESESWRVDVVLESLDVPEAMRSRPLKQLSGGWQRLAMLARTWVSEPDVLLLDEPTNHLDLEKIAQLEGWLNALPRDVPVILSSHDRAFLDATTNRTLFLRPELSPVFALPYTRARAALDEADASEARRYERDMKLAEQLRKQAAKLNNIGINSGSDLLVVKTKQLKQRAEKLEDAAKPAHLERSAGAIRLSNRGTHAKVLVTLEDAAVTTPDGTLLFKTGRQFICQGDRIVLLGLNGAGKSRLVSMLKQAIESPETARDSIKATPSLVLGYGDQALADLADTDTPIGTIIRRFDVGDQRARGLLAGAGMTIDMQAKPIGQLSGGQKARLGMLVLRLAEPNFYLLDEPTNHLDIEGQEALEGELMAHEASCLLVSHDRSFVRAVGNRFWLIERKRLVEAESPEGFFASVGSGV